MRRKKQKHTRRSVSFYKINYGFREPFKVLLDGNFLHACLAANMGHLQELLARLVGGEVRLFTTPCISGELRGLGPEFRPTADAARQQQLHKCGHEAAQAPSDCLLDAVAGGNPAHWWIATQARRRLLAAGARSHRRRSRGAGASAAARPPGTPSRTPAQDKALQAELGALQAVPVLFASVNGLHLAEPPEQAKAAVAAGHAEAQALPAHERASAPLRDLAELRPRDEGWKKFRRKRTKGPNPLAVKKKKQQAKPSKGAREAAAPAGAAAPGGGGGGEGGGSGKKRKRSKRKAGGAD
ncbi:UTP23 [Scenedesmus sp. PABB004]|nr:UTP23 [Scenedesmus sp. PABB004]